MINRVTAFKKIQNGEGGIRTHGTGMTPYNGLANRRFQPLSHLSKMFLRPIVFANTQAKYASSTATAELTLSTDIAMVKDVCNDFILDWHGVVCWRRR